MNVLMLSTDRSILDATSRAYARMEAYARTFGSLRIIVFAPGAETGERAAEGSLSVYCAGGGSRLLAYGRGIKEALQCTGDVISAQDPFEVGFAGLFIARRLRIPLQVQLHTDVGDPHFLEAGMRNRFQRYLARIVMPRASCVRVVSARVADNLARVGITLAQKPAIIPVYFDAHVFAAAAPSDVLRKKYPQFKTIVLWVGRFEREKDPLCAIRAFAETPLPSAGLVMVGTGRLRLSAEQLVKELSLSARVFFEDWQGDIASYYKSADVLLVTSRYEGYGLAIAEGLACGLPVVSLDVGIAKEAGAVVVAAAELSGTLAQIATSPHAAHLNDFFVRSEEEHLAAVRASLSGCAVRITSYA